MRPISSGPGVLLAAPNRCCSAICPAATAGSRWALKREMEGDGATRRQKRSATTHALNARAANQASRVSRRCHANIAVRDRNRSRAGIMEGKRLRSCASQCMSPGKRASLTQEDRIFGVFAMPAALCRSCPVRLVGKPWWPPVILRNPEHQTCSQTTCARAQVGRAVSDCSLFPARYGTEKTESG